MKEYTTSRFGYEFLLQPTDIYLDSATVGRLPKASYDEMAEFILKYNGYQRGGTHKIGINTSKALQTARERISSFFKVKPTKVSYIPSLETGMVNLIYSQKWKKEDRVITSLLEEHSIQAPLVKGKKDFGYNIDYLNFQDEKNLIEAIKENVTSETKMIFLSSLTIALGTKREWKEISQIARDNNIIFTLDAGRSVGHESIDLKGQSPDVVLCDGSKGALGPSGTAFQIISEEFAQRFDPILVGAGSVDTMKKEDYELAAPGLKFEPGTLNLPGIIGLGKSLEILNAIGLNKIEQHEKKLRKTIEETLRELNQITIYEIEEKEKGPIISFNGKTMEAFDIAIILEDLRNIIVRAGALCSHLLLNEVKQENVVQVSTHIYNTEEQIEIFVNTLQELMEGI